MCHWKRLGFYSTGAAPLHQRAPTSKACKVDLLTTYIATLSYLVTVSWERRWKAVGMCKTFGPHVNWYSPFGEKFTLPSKAEDVHPQDMEVPFLNRYIREKPTFTQQPKASLFRADTVTARQQQNGSIHRRTKSGRIHSYSGIPKQRENE